MSPTCKNEEIWRVAYSKTSGKSGSKKHVSVKGKCIKATSQTGKKTSLETKRHLSKRKKIHEIAREKFGTPECAKGEVIREGYNRKTMAGNEIWVQPTCIKDVGKTGKQESIFYIKPGRLSKYGYENISEKSELARHRALKDAMRSGEKPLSLSRRLNALATLTKNTNTTLSHAFKADSDWIKTTKEYSEK